jgi:glycosyltransferase involved in cell wall biosynthesis
MRILIATSSPYRAFQGQAIFTRNLAEGLVKNGNEVMVIASSENGKRYVADYKGVKINALKSIKLSLINPNAVLAIFTSWELVKVIKSFQPDIVHIQDHYPLCFIATRLAQKLGLRIIGTNHFMPENLSAYIPIIPKIKKTYSWILWHWMRYTYDRLNAVVAPSRTAAEMLKLQSIAPLVLAISCGANTEIFRPLPTINIQDSRTRFGINPHRKIFFFVGRVDKEKRLDVLLKAANLMDRSDFQVIIAGNGAYLKALKRLAKRLGLNDKVHFTGFIADEYLPSVLNSIDIFVMPSEAELLSIATVQAMACSKPILAADAVALPELVTNGVNGLLFRPGDIKDAARCMVYLVDHPEQWSTMGAESLQRTKKHNIEKIVSEYEMLYHSVLNKNPVTVL